MKKLFFSSLFFLAALGLAANAAFFVPAARAQDASKSCLETGNTVECLNESAVKIPAFAKQAAPANDYGTNFINTKVGLIISLVLSFVGVVFLILMIYAGLRWMLAGGNEQTVSEAKSLLINAVIGIVIVFAAYAITSFIGTNILTQ